MTSWLDDGDVQPDDPWDEYDRLRAAWMSRLMFGWMVDPPMPAGDPPEVPDA